MHFIYVSVYNIHVYVDNGRELQLTSDMYTYVHVIPSYGLPRLPVLLINDALSVSSNCNFLHYIRNAHNAMYLYISYGYM